MVSATFRLKEPAVIGRVDIVNCGSASVTVLVAKNNVAFKAFKELVPSQGFRTANECRNGSNTAGSRLLTVGQLRQDTRHEEWDFVRVICFQPYRSSKDEQYGLARFALYDAGNQSPSINNINKFKESAFRSSSPVRKELSFNGNLTRAQKMVLASKPPLKYHAQPDPDNDDIFRATVISFLDAHPQIITSKAPSDAKSELMQLLQSILDRKLTVPESVLFSQIFRSHAASLNEKPTSGILKPRTSNSQIFSTPGCKKMEDTKFSLLKPQLNDSFKNFNTQTVYWAEVVHNHGMKDGPVSYMGRSGKENTPYLLEKNGLINGDTACGDSHGAVISSDNKMCVENGQRDKFSPRDSWKSRNDIDQCDSRDCSPDTLLKRKSDPSERFQPTNKKRPRDSTCVEEDGRGSMRSNRVTPSGGWLLNGSGLDKKNVSPADPKNQDSMKFPFRVSPPPPPDRPASPLPLVDDIDQPSTSSRETVAERNIRLDLERRLAERSPPEQVVQRTSAGKVKGPFCTKGMNTNDSPLRRLSICDENEEFGSPQARRKLSFVPLNGHNVDSDEVIECPVCKGFFGASEIHKHLDECAPSPIKKPDDGENEDEMACPICGMWQPKDTVAAHADECAQKRYGA